MAWFHGYRHERGGPDDCDGWSVGTCTVCDSDLFPSDMCPHLRQLVCDECESVNV